MRALQALRDAADDPSRLAAIASLSKEIVPVAGPPPAGPPPTEPNYAVSASLRDDGALETLIKLVETPDTADELVAATYQLIERLVHSPIGGAPRQTRLSLFRNAGAQSHPPVVNRQRVRIGMPPSGGCCPQARSQRTSCPSRMGLSGR